MALDVSPSLIVYANPCKQKSHIEFARKKGVKLSTFDNEEELYKMRAIQPDAELLIRILPPLSEKAKVPLGISMDVASQRLEVCLSRLRNWI